MTTFYTYLQSTPDEPYQRSDPETSAELNIQTAVHAELLALKDAPDEVLFNQLEGKWRRSAKKIVRAAHLPRQYSRLTPL
jgi:hypothetical protein